jgi:hypothetical protein
MLLRALALILLVASPAFAQDASTLIEEGLALRREGRDGEAAERFRQAYAIDRSGRSLAQLALAEQAGGEWVNAERDLVQALEIDDPWIAEHRAVLEAALATIRSHLGRLHVVTNAPSGTVLVDGREAGSLPMDAPISTVEGTLTVEVRAPGYRTVERTVMVRAGAMSRLNVDLIPERSVDPDPDPDPDPVAAPSSGPSAAWIVGLTGVGLTVVALGAMAGAIAVRENNAQRWNDEAQCDPQPPAGRMESCPGLWESIHTAQDAAIALGIVGGALGVASIVSIAIGASSGESIALGVGPTYAELRVAY